MIGELTNPDPDYNEIKATPTPPVVVDHRKMMKIPPFNLSGVGFFSGEEQSSQDYLAMKSRKDEDLELVETTSSFANWVAAFVRRVILLLENLPEEGVTGNYSGGASESESVSSFRMGGGG
jgi:proteasome activator subunit 4